MSRKARGRWRGSSLCLFIFLAAGAWAAEPIETVTPTPEQPAAVAAPRVLTLQECVQVAMQKNPAVLSAEEQVRRAQALVSEAKSYYGPRLSANAAHTRTGPIPTVTIPTSTGTETFQIGVPETTTARVSASLPIDALGLIKTAVDGATLARMAQEFALAAVRQNISLQLQEAYLGTLRAEGLEKVAQEALAAGEEHLRVAKAHFAAGTVAYFDVLRAEVQTANFRQRLLEAQNAVQLAKSGLNFAMGEDVNQPLEVQAPLEQPASPHLSVEEGQAEASRRRPEILQAQAQLGALQKGVRLAGVGLLPAVSLAGDRNFNANPSAFGGLRETWDVSAQVSFPFFDSGQTRAKVRQARADAETARHAEQQTRNQVMLEVRSAHLSLQEAQARLGVAEKDVEQAREALRLAQLRYQAGLSAAVEMIDAEVALAQSSTSRVNAFYDLLLALARLEKAVGRPLAEMEKTSP